MGKHAPEDWRRVRSSAYGIVVVKNNRSNHSCRADHTLRCPSAPSNHRKLSTVSAQKRRHRAHRRPDQALKCPVTQKTTSGKRRKAQRQPTASELPDSANDTKHADVVSGEQNGRQGAKKRREVVPKWLGRPLPPVPHPQPPAQRTKGGGGLLAQLRDGQIGRVVRPPRYLSRHVLPPVTTSGSVQNAAVPVRGPPASPIRVDRGGHFYRSFS